MFTSMKDELREFLRRFGAFKIGVADPERGFGMARDGCRSRDIMRGCNSVIVFAIHVGLDYYTTLDFRQEGDVESRVLHIYRDWISFQLANFLEEMGYKAVIPHGYVNKRDMVARLSFKLAAYEAGLGAFGRSSLLITPEYGPRINLGAVLTDAVVQPDGPLKGFNPCQGCDVCAKLCPASAINKEVLPPTGFNRERCLEFVRKIRERTKGKIMLCGYCYNCCPVGDISEKAFNLRRWRTLLDLNEDERRSLLEVLNA